MLFVSATVVGSQSGDEGEGSDVDLFGDAADVVVRDQGGAGVGPTVTVADDEFELRSLPSGVALGRLASSATGAWSIPTRCSMNSIAFASVDTTPTSGYRVPHTSSSRSLWY